MIYEQVDSAQMAEAANQLIRVGVRTFRQEWRQGHWFISTDVFRVGSDGDSEQTTDVCYTRILDLRSRQVHQQLTLLGHDAQICYYASVPQSQ